jgi:OOP family OmpA-OmpF porin
MEGRKMSRTLTVVALAAALLSGAGCSSFYQATDSDLKAATSAQPRGTAFDTALARDYLSLANVEYASNDPKDGDAYARRSLAASQGRATLPDDPKLREYLPAKLEPDLSQARQRLVAALEKNNRTARPETAARAQAYYDCWLEQSEENIQPDHIQACRDRFMTALAELEKPLPVAPAPAAKAAVPDRFLVFFDWNKATLTAEARSVLAEAARTYKEQGQAKVIATGFTDRSGPYDYNLKLSVRRADAVKAELVRLGVPAAAITTIGRGENDPLVPTADGVREPQNRRVEIQMQKPAGSS